MLLLYRLESLNMRNQAHNPPQARLPKLKTSPWLTLRRVWLKTLKKVKVESSRKRCSHWWQREISSCQRALLAAQKTLRWKRLIRIWRLKGCLRVTEVARDRWVSLVSRQMQHTSHEARKVSRVCAHLDPKAVAICPCLGLRQKIQMLKKSLNKMPKRNKKISQV